MTSQELGDLREMTGRPRIGHTEASQRGISTARKAPIDSRLGDKGKLETKPDSRPASFSCTLAMPPSVNGLFAGKSRRYKSTEYKAWIRAAFGELYFTGCLDAGDDPRISGRIKASYIFHFQADYRKRDIANYEKALSDFLVARGVIEDDSCIDEMVLKRGYPTGLSSENKTPYVEVRLEVISE